MIINLYLLIFYLEDNIQEHTKACEDSIANCAPQKMVENTSSIARLANRVLMVAKQESDNSEDPYFVERVNQAADLLQSSKSYYLILFYHFFLSKKGFSSWMMLAGFEKEFLSCMVSSSSGDTLLHVLAEIWNIGKC